jgi:hypothetical protein
VSDRAPTPPDLKARILEARRPRRNLLLALRERTGLSPVGLARRAGTTQPVVSRLESGLYGRGALRACGRVLGWTGELEDCSR